MGSGITCSEEQTAQCNAPDCVNAVHNFNTANNQTALDCQQLSSDTSQRNAWAAAAAACLAAAIASTVAAAAAAGTFFGIPAAIVLWSIAAIMFTLVIIFGIVVAVYQNKVNADNATIAVDMKNAQAAASAVQENCPICCTPMLQIFSCS